MKTFLYYFGLFVLFIILVMISAFTYFIFYPSETIKYTYTTEPVLTKKVHPGSDVVYLRKFCSYTSGVLFAYRTLTNTGGTIIYPSSSTADFLVPGCFSYHVHYPISKDVKPGTYHLVIISEFHVYYIRVVYKLVSTENFQVVP